VSAQLKHDEERGLTPERIIEFVLVVTMGGPSWKIVKAASVLTLTLKKMGFKIVPMEREDYEQG